ncbi:MAG: undecaprenyldiphospho-muramoylpentapeptide beta-N-acetylglucosaminyltransferase [Pantoea sp. Brub]|nr:undecaprenyldiphospho-muramoylpentapeptide beta-N-acetylglucosaminyltransferase [Pantoea sp. Brub]
MIRKKLMIIAGGTGGHIFPGLTIANYMIELGWKVFWLGSTNRMENELVCKNGIQMYTIKIKGLRGSNIKSKLLAPINIFTAFIKSRKFMKLCYPDVVLGMGGYVSGPSSLAAWSYKIPLLLHEQNSIAGLTNKYLSKFATKIMQGFPGAFTLAEVVGNPIRKDILNLPLPDKRLNRNGPIRVLVIGGSQGANILNTIMPQVALNLNNKIIVWHLTGKNRNKQTEKIYHNLGLNQHNVTDFIENISVAYEWADVVVCRSGALTVSEIAAIGLAAIFIPFPHKDQQQYWNAIPLVKIGAAKIFHDQECTVRSITETLKQWNREILLQMAQRARKVAIYNATERIAKEIIDATTI